MNNLWKGVYGLVNDYIIQGNMWIQISSGKGPDECELAVGLFLKAYLTECKIKGLNAKVVDVVPGNYSDNYKSILLSIEEEIENLEGSILWICKSPYRPNYKRKNWFIDVEMFNSQEKLNFSEKEVRFEAMRSSGPGGQNVNKVESAVRAIHLPTGLTVTAREERSQHMNKKLALVRISKLINCKNSKDIKDFKTSMWLQHNTLERGNPIRIYEGIEYKPKV